MRPSARGVVGVLVCVGVGVNVGAAVAGGVGISVGVGMRVRGGVRGAVGGGAPRPQDAMTSDTRVRARSHGPTVAIGILLTRVYRHCVGSRDLPPADADFVQVASWLLVALTGIKSNEDGSHQGTCRILV